MPTDQPQTTVLTGVRITGPSDVEIYGSVREAARRLLSLLDDPRPSLATWCISLDRAHRDLLRELQF